MQLGLIDEEYQEFRSAFHNEPYENELKELADLVYVCFQYAENMEWDLEEALDRVHKSNMSKLGLDGTPIRRADGKVLKGPNYKPPVLPWSSHNWDIPSVKARGMSSNSQAPRLTCWSRQVPREGR